MLHATHAVRTIHTLARQHLARGLALPRKQGKFQYINAREQSAYAGELEMLLATPQVRREFAGIGSPHVTFFAGDHSAVPCFNALFRYPDMPAGEAFCVSSLLAIDLPNSLLLFSSTPHEIATKLTILQLGVNDTMMASTFTARTTGPDYQSFMGYAPSVFQPPPPAGPMIQNALPDEVDMTEGALSIKKATRTLEEQLIRRALTAVRGNRGAAAKLLEVSHRALLYKINEYKINIPPR